MFEDLSEIFENTVRGLEKIEKDIPIAIEKIDLSNKSDPVSKEKLEKLSFKSLKPMTDLRKNKEELLDARENPEATFIMDRIKELLSK